MPSGPVQQSEERMKPPGPKARGVSLMVKVLEAAVVAQYVSGRRVLSGSKK